MERASRWTAITLLVLGVTACGEPISEPWLSGGQAETLEAERTRSDAQEQELRARLRRYGDAYQ